MGRLPTFDYSSPFYYMVTLRKARGARCFSEIVPEHEPPRDRNGRLVYLRPTPVTRIFSAVVRAFHLHQAGIAPITCFIVMPDHLHLLIRLTGTVPGISLVGVVARLRTALASAISRPGEAADTVFNPAWHDWVVKRRCQLARFTRYIRRNPYMAWVRAMHPEYFMALHWVDFLGHAWHAYGNAELLEGPVLASIRGHRTTRPGTAAWVEAKTFAGRLGPGTAGIGTFMSPLERACGNAICQAGGGVVVLRPEGFPLRWHPSEKLAPLVAEGRMLFLSLYAPQAGRLTKGELGARCHAMGDIVARQLPLIEG